MHSRYKRRLEEGYDLPDALYEEWKAGQLKQQVSERSMDIIYSSMREHLFDKGEEL